MAPWVTAAKKRKLKQEIELISNAFAVGGPAVIVIQRGSASPADIASLVAAVANLSEVMGRVANVDLVFPDGSLRPATASECGWQSLEWDTLTVRV